MKTKPVLRIVSLIMFVIAAVFVLIALSCPTCGSVFYIGSICIGSDVWCAFYLCVMFLLFLLSYLLPKKNPRG